MITIQIPKSLELDTLLKEKYPELYSHLEKFYYIIHIIRLKWFQDNRYKDLSNVSKKARKKLYIPLKSEYLKHLLGSDYYKKIIDILLTENILETNNWYQPGKFSKGFKLSNKYLINKGMNYNLTDKTLIKKVELNKEKEMTNMSDLNKQITEVIKTKFTFDYTNAFKLIAQQRNVKLLDKISYSRCFNHIEEIKNGNITIQESQLTGRIFHLYSNIKKELRNFIKHNSNDTLIEIDIANSQPFFLGLIISQLEQTADTKLFIKIVSNGTFYSYLKDKLEIECDDYNSLKQEILTLLYCPSYWNINIKNKFEEIFSTVTEAMKIIKAEDYKNLAIELQRMEAELMIKDIIPNLLERGIDFIPIHDSFIIEESNKEAVVNIINETFTNKYKMIPTLKIKKRN